MAKTSNGLGKFSGKLGGAVFVIRNGQQIVREYNPRPSNPKSDLQTAQRAKGNLAGRISSLTPKAAIFGLGSNAAARRSRYLQLLLNAAQVTKVDNNYNAKVPWQDVIFSEGSVISPFLFVSASASANALDVTLNTFAASQLPSELYGALNARLVAMVYDLATSQLVEVVTKIVNRPAQGASAATRLTVSHPAGYTAAIYVVPMSTEDGSAVSISSSQALMDDQQIAAALSVNGSAVVFKYGRSSLLGQAAFTPTLSAAKKKDE